MYLWQVRHFCKPFFIQSKNKILWNILIILDGDYFIIINEFTKFVKGNTKASSTGIQWEATHSQPC